VFGGCAELVIEPDGLCETATHRLKTCGATIDDAVFEGCSPDIAEEILNTQCSDMAHVMSAVIPKKTRGDVLKRNRRTSGGFACRMGFMTTCPKETCEETEDIAPPAEDDPCIEWTRYSGCKGCEYYRCRERESQCGDEGYLVGYVGKYCDRFSTITEPRLSDAGAEWMENVRLCLVDTLDRETDHTDTCERIEEVGIQSHASCYVQSGFCQLSFTDWFAIIHTIDAFDIPFQQILATGHRCLGEWFGGR